MRQKVLCDGHFDDAAVSTLGTGSAQAQTTGPTFQIVEATIDDIHMAFRSGGSVNRDAILVGTGHGSTTR
jgi:hypothetical protein